MFCVEVGTSTDENSSSLDALDGPANGKQLLYIMSAYSCLHNTSVVFQEPNTVVCV